MLTASQRISVAVVVTAAASLVGAGSGLATPTLHGVGQASTASATSSLVIDRPPGTLPGDVLVAVVNTNLHLATSITQPAGWYLIRRDGTTTSGTRTALSQSLYYHVAGALEPPSYTWLLGKKTGAAGAVLAYGGVSTGAPIADHAGRLQSNVTSIVAPSIAPGTGGTTLLGFFGTLGTYRVTPPAAMTERHDISSSGSSLTSSESADAPLAGTGATGERTATVATSTRRAVGQLVALNPLTTPPPPPPPPPPSPPPPPPPPPPGSVTLTSVDGGPSYYSQFTNPLPNNVFPIGVWGSYAHETANRNLDAAAGINTYVWVADTSYMDDIRADGRFHVIQDEDLRAGVGVETAGWVLADEIDMQQEAAAARNQLNSILAGLPADGRIRYANYGKGVMFWNSDSDAEQFVNDFTQVVSTDIYWFTEGDVCSQYQGGKLLGLNRNLTSAECHRASNYGAQVTRVRFLDGLDGKRQPVWSFVETGHPFDNNMGGHRSITAPEMRAAVWHSIIAGARGIIYFQHSFGGPCSGDHHTIRSNCEGTRPMVTSVNAQIKSLAAVLNSPTVTSGYTASSSVKAMVKWDGSNFYVFAGSTNNAASTGTFSIPCVGTATAAVLGEARAVAVTNGSFTDSFADGNAVHIYRIDGGSSCGLT